MARLLLVATLLCGLLIAACGGSDSDGAKQRFIADGDKLCDSLGERFAELAATRVSQSPTGTVRNAARYRSLTRELSDGLARIELPKGDREARRLVGLAARLTSVARSQKITAQRIIEAIDEHDAAAVRRRARAFNRVARGEQISVATSFDRGMHAYGFKNCGRSA
jgi:hypothetical protein